MLERTVEIDRGKGSLPLTFSRICRQACEDISKRVQSSPTFLPTKPWRAPSSYIFKMAVQAMQEHACSLGSGTVFKRQNTIILQSALHPRRRVPLMFHHTGLEGKHLPGTKQTSVKSLTLSTKRRQQNQEGGNELLLPFLGFPIAVCIIKEESAEDRKVGANELLCSHFLNSCNRLARPEHQTVHHGMLPSHLPSILLPLPFTINMVLCLWFPLILLWGWVF